MEMIMRHAKKFRFPLIAAALIGSQGIVYGESVNQKSIEPDNTGRNEKIHVDRSLTADDQSNSDSDLKIVQRIRKDIMAQDNFSTLAQNVKIIVRDGAVQLKGPVKSADEKNRIESIAEQAVGAGKVKSHLEVKM
jgi:osmotically-inducible protein OsmY